MSLPFAMAIYFIVWWIVLFTVLPIGMRTQGEEGHVEPGTPASAPVEPRLFPKIILTTILASLVFAFIYAVIVHKIIELDNISFLPSFESLS